MSDDDALGRCPCLTWARTPEMGEDVAGHHPRCHQTYFTKERFDALTAERDEWREYAREGWAGFDERTAERDALAARLAAAEAALSPCTLALEYRDGVTCREERDRGVCLNHRVIEGLRVHAVTADRLEIENRALRRQVRATYGIIHEGLHGGKPTDPEHQELCERPSCRNARAALAGSREQAAGEGA